jgi:hypothetical protein
MRVPLPPEMRLDQSLGRRSCVTTRAVVACAEPRKDGGGRK